jgi:hypothetical protein
MTSGLVGGEWPASRASRFTSGERAPGTHWIGGWVGLRAGLDDVEERKFLTLPGLELRSLGHPARSQSLYRLRYPGSCSWYKSIVHVQHYEIILIYCINFIGNHIILLRHYAFLICLPSFCSTCLFLFLLKIFAWKWYTNQILQTYEIFQ